MEKDKLPWWKEAGLTVAGGWHPITGRLRRHIPSENEEADYLWEYTEEHILRLKELGITLLVSQFDRGLGDTDQAEDQERARLQAELCHKHGLRHGVYLANTVYYESMLKDYPECEDWVVVTHDGRKVHYGGEQTWRWLACFNSPGWRERMRRQIERAVNQVRTDWLHFDNLEVWPEPESCHCRYCQEAFRKFLYRRYPDPASQKRRFGYTGFETFRAPNFYLRFGGPWDLDRVECPLMQEWILFRCWQVTDYFQDLSGYARSLNPAIGIDSNGQCIRGVNHSLVHGVDHGAQAEYADAVWDENPDYRPEEHPGAIYPSTVKFRGANFLRRLGKEVLGGYKDEETLAANLTFTGHPGINHAWGYAEPGRLPLNPAQPGVAELLEHQRRNRGLYAGLRPAGRIGLWRSHLSLAFVSTETHLSAFVLEQTLFNHRIPFSIIFDQQLTTAGLKDFDLLILPDAEFVSDEQVALLTAFVEAGGRLLITEKSGRFTAEPRRRVRPAFSHLFSGGRLRTSGSQSEETGIIESHRQFVEREFGGEKARTEYGRGRAAYLPRIDYLYRPHAFQSRYHVFYDGIDSRYWKEPLNREELLAEIEWLYPEYRPLRVADTPELRLDYLAWPDGRLGAALLRCGPLAGAADLRLAVRAAAAPEAGEFWRPEERKPLELKWEKRGGDFETILVGLGRHGVVRWRLKE